MTHADLFETIERVLPEGGDWCSIDRASTLASLVLALRPRTALEVGIWMGGSAVPIMLAMDYLTRADGASRAFLAIDPWDASASVAGQQQADAQWWSGVDHEAAYQAFCGRLRRHELGTLCTILRMPSDQVEIARDVEPKMALIDLLSIDGNHAEQAIRDVAKFAPHVPIGGVIALDDIHWTGGCVARARELALSMGFDERYRVDTTAILQRMRHERWS